MIIDNKNFNDYDLITRFQKIFIKLNIQPFNFKINKFDDNNHFMAKFDKILSKGIVNDHF